MLTHFDPALDLIVVTSRVWGPRGRVQLSFALDTASAATVVAPHVVDDLGFSPRDGTSITTVCSAIGKEQGYALKVARFAALGFSIADFELHVFDLAVGHDIDGLIGLSFLRHFDYEVCSLAARIDVRPAVPAPVPA